MTVILQVFDDRHDRLRLDDVAIRTGLPRSTCHRILDELVRLDWLQHTGQGYALGYRTAQLADTYDDQFHLRRRSHPVLEQLHAHTRATIHLGILHAGDVVYLDKLGELATPHPSVGGRAPAHATALGKAMLAWFSAEEVEVMLPPRLSAKTRNTITQWPALNAELQAIRNRKGLAFERGEHLEGVFSIAAAILDAHRVVGAISLSAEPVAGAIDRFGPLILRAAAYVSASMSSGSEGVVPPDTTWPEGLMDLLLAQVDEDTLL